MLALKTIKRTAARKLMLFDLVHTGHHANYIRHLVKYWGEHQLLGELYIVVSPQFLQRHPDVIDLGAHYGQNSIKFIAISSQAISRIEANKSFVDRALRSLKEWQLFCKYARTLAIDHCVFLYFDTCEIPMVLGFEPPCPISGIYFRPTFHYTNFASHRHVRGDRLRHWRERLFLHKTFHNSKLRTLFCLDTLSTQPIQQLYPKAHAIPLADPVENPERSVLSPQNLVKKHNILPGRQVFILFGAITERKGIYQLLKAIAMLSADICKKLCILLVGEVQPDEKPHLCCQIELARNLQPIQLIAHFEFVSECEMQAYFQLADVVLALYQRHVGMSGILLLAAAAQKPVLSSDYGLMGELVRRYQLGLSLDSTSPDAIAHSLTQVLNQQELPYNLEKMKAFVAENSATRFAETIFQHV